MSRPLAAFLVGTAVSGALIVAAARGDVDRMTLGDGHIHRYVALHLTTPAEQVDPAIAESGTSLRYGRIGWPIVLFVTSAGSEAAIRYTQPLVTALAGGAAVAALAALLPGAAPPLWLALFVAPAFSLSVAGGFAEVPALALALWGLVAALRARWWWAAVAFAAATLTKETAITVLAGAVLWRWRARWWPATSALVPVAAWHLAVRARFGHLPLRDPYLSSGRGVTTPVVGLWQSLTSPLSTGSFLVAAAHTALGAAFLPFVRRSVFALCGALAALPLLVTTPHTPWRFIGDGFRTSIFLEAFAVLAVLESRLRRHELAG